MAVTPEGTEQASGPAAAAPSRSAAPGRHQDFEVDPRVTALYRAQRAALIGTLGLWFRPEVTGKENVPATGPVILAPVHRSFADFSFAAFCTPRKIFFMTKDEMWERKWLGRWLLTVGAFPVHRESADREAVQRAQAVLDRGQCLVLFPEGTRRSGPVVEDLMEGAAFLAARTGAPIVPIGIGASDLSMPKGSLVPKPYRIHLVVGEPLDPPARTGGGRVSRSSVHATTEALREHLQRVYDEARARSGRY
ncbi:MAG TPA: lysophospholipid acyltransferase family protein [Acidimicrobiales bacterium]|nr:lysophospholipid acyltransferase family protein [Acidimicrobiales bacterium]